jgi:hypothetical protein
MMTVQAQVESSTGRILAYGDFPAGSPSEDIAIVDLDPVEAAKLAEPGEKTIDAEGVITVTPPPEPDPPPPSDAEVIAAMAGTIDPGGNTAIGELSIIVAAFAAMAQARGW